MDRYSGIIKIYLYNKDIVIDIRNIDRYVSRKKRDSTLKKQIYRKIARYNRDIYILIAKYV